MQKTNFFLNTYPNDTISYKYINEECVEKIKLTEINVIGCTIENSFFEDVNFNLSDFDGTMIIQCKFVKGDWSRTDCCSLTVSNTVFKEVDFSLSTMRNCDFEQCVFIGCDFNHIALSGSRFTKCTFRDIYLSHSSTYLNIYESCIYESCTFSGAFYYNLLLHNTYTNVSFKQKLLAYNYFLMSQIDELATIGFSDIQKEELKSYLSENKLLINLVILSLNETNDVDLSLIRFIIAIGEILKAGLLVREEQLQFIQKFLRFLLNNEMISAVTIVECLSYLEKDIKFFDSSNSTVYEKCRESLNLIKNELYQVYQIMGSSINCFNKTEETDQEHIIKLIYCQEPQIPICSIINEIKQSLGINAPEAIRLKTETGSFIEWISCYDSALQCLQLFVAVLGLGYTIIREQKKEEKENDSEKESLPNITSTQMIDILNKALSKQKINPEFSQTISIVVKNEIVATKKFRGYSKSNIQSIDIIRKNG